MKTFFKILYFTILLGFASGSAIAQNSFITTWQTDNPGTSNSTSITIPTTGSGYNYDVDWDDDGSFDQIGITGNVTHDFGTAGTYTIRIRGTFPRIYFNDGGDKEKILSVDQWGIIAWTSMENAFWGCYNLTSTATDVPDLSGVTDMSNMFCFATSFNQPLNNWDVDNVEDMNSMFYGATSFNQPINNWDVDNVEDMGSMFLESTSFNQPLFAWNVSSVSNMNWMFFSADAFNQNLNSWDVSNVTDMSAMFSGVDAFNQPLNNWIVSSVTDMSAMFRGANVFNQNLSSWDVSNVTDMMQMFYYADAFNQNLGSWDVTNVTDMTNMLSSCNMDLIIYDSTLIGWEAQSVQSNVTLGANGLEYCEGETARTSLISSDNWTITGDSKNCPTQFITTWKTDNPGSSNDYTITIPTTGSGYNYSVNWGDGNTTTGHTTDATHIYSSVGTYIVKIFGNFPRIYFNNTGDKEKIISVQYWGDNIWTSMENAFWGCSNLTTTAFDNPTLSGATSMSNMFRGASSFNSDISNWILWSITNISWMFFEATSFDQPLNNWWVDDVTNMSGLFAGATSFNQDLSSWDVGNVTNMVHMFNGATSFNQDLSSWTVSSVTNMSWMFKDATAFNQNLAGWNIGNVTSMQDMLSNSGIDLSNYDNILLGWENQTVQSNVVLGATGLEYCTAEPARKSLITNDSWTITGDENTCDFVTIWRTDNPGTSSSTSITIPTFSGETYNYDVDWDNDGTYDQTGITGDVTHDFGTAETYTIRIKGTFPRIYFNNTGDRRKLVEIEQWGSNTWASMEKAFYGCTNLTLSATDNPDLSNVTNMSYMFANSSLNTSVNNWDVSNVTNMGGVFKEATSFNQSLNSWTVSNVTDMSDMFRGATSFNQSLNSWAVNNVTNFSGMFTGASTFNQPLNSWNVSSATNMQEMFTSASSFNQPLYLWTVSNVTDMSVMFSNATSFNQNINNWDVSKVTTMYWMFSGATSFNQPLNTWVVSSVLNMSGMFWGASVFNHTIDSWFSSSSLVQDMSYMFADATDFNKPLNSWQASNVTNMSYMFKDAASFNQPLNSWWVANVTDMEGMFNGASVFNQPLSSWNVANVTNMESMFENANAFDQSLGDWTVASVTNMLTMFYTSSGSLSIENYDNTLIGWESKSFQNNVDLGAQNLKYCIGESARNSLVTYGWNILGDTKDCPPALTITLYSANTTFVTIPTFPGETYDYSVDWDNDGVYDQIGITGDATYDFGVLETYTTVRIRGVFPRIYFNNGSSKEKITDIVQWSDNEWTSMENAFYGCSNLTITAIDAPDLSAVTNMANMFNGASNFNININSWDVSSITNMSGLFKGATSFNQPLSSWIVSGVTNMSEMFYGASSFNQPLSSWTTSAVTNMSGMFQDATSFNQTIDTWSVNLVTDMSNMFQNATSFNQALNSLTVSGVTDMSAMFYGATSFNQPLNQWIVSNVQFFNGMFANATAFNQNIDSWTPITAVVMEGMFLNATSFNEPINSWNVSTVQTMIEMFKGATSFNQSLNSWTVSGVTVMAGMFHGATAFNGAIGSWNVSNVTLMAEMFKNATSFNQSLNSWVTTGLSNTTEMFSGATAFNGTIGSWNMTGVTDLTAMFAGATNFNQSLNGWTITAATDLTGFFANATSFNQPLNLWNVSNITIMEGVFDGASAFNQNLGGWTISNVTNMIAMLNHSGLDMDNYDNTLIGWQNQSPNIHFNVPLGALNLKYCQSATARASLISTDNWIISGDAEDCPEPFITTWHTDNPGSSNSTSITIPTTGSGYNYDVDWDNDGTYDQFGLSGDVTHDYGTIGTYTIRITGSFPRIYFDNGGDKYKLLSIDQWGEISWSSMERAFYGCENMTSSATDEPDLSIVTSTALMFCEAVSFNSPVNSWNVSNITDMSNMFNNTILFNQPLSSWNTSSVVDMTSMFTGVGEFDQNLGGWDITSVQFMNNMLDNTGLGTDNYDNTLIGWESQGVQLDVELGAQNLNYCAGESARDELLGMPNWTITGDSKECSFITTWKTDNTGTSGSTEIIIPTFSGETYDYKVDWDNDGTYDEYSISGDVTHNFGIAGTYTIRIGGTFPRIYFNDGGDKDKILSIDKWGDNAWTSMEDAFYGCSNLTSAASFAPNLSNVTDMSNMFGYASSFNSNIDNWDVSNVTNTSSMFFYATSFNQPLNDWDVGNVTDMHGMFIVAADFNQPLDNWDVDNVTDMSSMFWHAYDFNQPLNNWDVDNVTEMYRMFANTNDFNQPLNNWDVDNVTDMRYMFSDATVFNQNLGDWDIGNVTDMSEMFDNSGLDITNYDSTLIGWENQTVQSNVTLDVTGLEYCDAFAARYNLIHNSNWTITGDSHQCPCKWVVNTNDAGSGSLREAMSCSSADDTIKFSPALVNVTILVTSSTLSFGHKVSLVSSLSNNITIDASAIGKAFHTSSGIDANMEGLKIICGNSTTTRCLENNSSMILKDIEFTDSNAGTGGNSVLNNGTLNFEGNVKLQ